MAADNEDIVAVTEWLTSGLITHRCEGGNDQSGSLISFDNDGESKEPERSVSVQCVNEDSGNVAHVEEDAPKLPPKVSQQSKQSHSGKAPPPPIPPRADLLEPEGTASGEPSRKTVHLDTHAQDSVPVPTHSEKPSTQADAPKKKVPVKPPRGKLKAPQINQSPSENKPAASPMDIQEQVASSFSDDIAAAFDPLKEPTVDLNLSSAIPDLPKPPDEDVDLKTSNEQAVKERAAPIYGNIKDVESNSPAPIGPTRPASHAPTRTGLKKPVPTPRSRVKSEDGVLVTALTPDKKVADGDKEESSTVLDHSLQARSKSFSTPGNRRFNPPEEKPSTMPRCNSFPKRVAPPPPPSWQTGSSLKDKRSFPYMPLPPLLPVDTSEKLQDHGAHQKDSLAGVLSPGTSEPGPEADYASPGSTSVADLSIYEAIDSKEDQQVDESGEIDYSSDDSLDDLVILPEFGAKLARGDSVDSIEDSRMSKNILSPGVRKSNGFLWKQGGQQNNKGWRKRWFVFDGKDLRYFNDKHNLNESRHIIPVSQIRDIEPIKNSKRPTFKVITPNRTLILASESTTEMNLWSQTLMEAIITYTGDDKAWKSGGDMCDPDKEGWLKKQGHNMVAYWKKRYVAVKDDKICYYDTYEDFVYATPINCINAALAKVKTVEGHKNRFVIITFNKSYSFEGDSEFDAASWIIAIETAIQIGLGGRGILEKVWENRSNRYCAHCGMKGIVARPMPHSKLILCPSDTGEYIDTRAPKYSDKKDSGVSPAHIIEKSPLVADTNMLTSDVTNKGGVVVGEGVKLMFPPEAVKNSLSITISLEDASKYYGLIVQKDLENDIMFGAPIINLTPNGHFFKKPVTLTTKLKIQNFKCGDVLILNGTEAQDGKITWQDITDRSKFTMLDEFNIEVNIKIEHFSLVVALLRMTLIRTKEIVSRLNLLSFNYNMSVLLKENRLSPIHGELAVLFVSQDVYHEQFYREHETSALVQLKNEGFRELHVRLAGSTDAKEEKRIYNSELLQVSVRLGGDFSLGDSQNGSIGFTVDSYVWWNMGKVIKLPLEFTKDVGILCGAISVQGQYGHTSERHFCETDLCGYVRSLLGVEGSIFNVIPIAQVLETPDEIVNQLMKVWNDEDEQLRIILQYRLKEDNVVEDLAALRSILEGLKQEGYRVTQRGQMHIRHLREYSTKISGMQCENADLMKYFSCRIKTFCKTLLRDCCIEMEVSAEGVETAASSSDHIGYLAMHRSIPNDITRKYQMISASCADSTTRTFLAIVPNLIQNTKEIFVDERFSEVQNGLWGLSEETVEQFVLNIRNAEQNNRIRQLACEVCKILELLCLKNCGKQPTSEIKKWCENLAILSMLGFLKVFFQHCRQNIRLHKRLELFSGRLRDIMSDEWDITNEVVMHEFCNVAQSLSHFAKFNPSKLVRFELTDSTNSPVNCHSEDVEYDRCHDTFSQQFHVKKESEDELQLHAVACVHVDGQVYKIGAFQSIVMLRASGEEAFDRCMVRFVDVAVIKLEDQGLENRRRVVLCSTQKEKLSEVLDDLKRQLNEDLVDLRMSEISQCRLKMHSISTNVGAVLSLRLLYKWRFEAVTLDSRDFVTLADSSAGGASFPEVELVGLNNPLMSEVAALSLASSDGNVALGAFDQLQKHAQIPCEKIEFHVHQTVNNMTGHVCVAGDKATLNEQMPIQRALQEGPGSAPRRSITGGKRS